MLDHGANGKKILLGRQPAKPLPPPVRLTPRKLDVRKLLQQCSPYPLFAIAQELQCPVPGIYPVLFGFRRNDPAGQQVRQLACTTNPDQQILAILRDAVRWGVTDLTIPVNI